MLTEALYLDHDNASHLVLREDGDAVADLSSLTRVVVTIDDVDYDSDLLGSSKIWWTDQAEYPAGSGTNVDVLKFQLGSDCTSVAGQYDDCRVVVYDATNPNGIVWTSSLTVFVR